MDRFSFLERFLLRLLLRLLLGLLLSCRRLLGAFPDQLDGFLQGELLRIHSLRNRRVDFTIGDVGAVAAGSQGDLCSGFLIGAQCLENLGFLAPPAAAALFFSQQLPGSLDGDGEEIIFRLEAPGLLVAFDVRAKAAVMGKDLVVFVARVGAEQARQG